MKEDGMSMDPPSRTPNAMRRWSTFCSGAFSLRRHPRGSGVALCTVEAISLASKGGSSPMEHPQPRTNGAQVRWERHLGGCISSNPKTPPRQRLPFFGGGEESEIGVGI